MLKKETNQDIKTLLQKFENKECFILTTFDIRYKAHNLKISESHISFTDKFGTDVLLSISDIKQIAGVNENGYQ